VAAHKKKIVVFLLTATVGSCMLAVCSVQSTTAEPEKPSFDNSRSLFTSDPNFSPASADNLGTRELFFKMMLSVLLVVVLGAAAIYISKRFLPKITNLPGKEIRIIETVHLGPRKAVHLLKIGSQWILIGSTNESITKLADVTDALSEADLSATDNNEDIDGW
jgi:flagellar biosynthetic protein FliO